jgi:Putative peptidoglycan binding domain
MTLRTGMPGAAVGRVQERLKGFNLYSGPLDSMFGGGTESAVKRYQKSQQLPQSGAVDARTWGAMFPGEPPPSSEVAGQSLLHRCLALTGTFETSHYPPDSFLGLTGDFDGMSISFGVCQWNIGQGSLQPLLQRMFDEHEPVAADIFHEHLDTMKALGSSTLSEQLAFSRSIQTKGQVNEPWRGMLLTLGRTPEFQDVQTKHAAGIYEKALELCRVFGLRSERAVALIFDLLTQNGSIGSTVQAAILADFSRLSKDGPDGEVEKMRIVANRRAAAVRPEYVDDVRTRKLTIANGVGTVHGIVYDLQDMYGITLGAVAT